MSDPHHYVAPRGRAAKSRAAKQWSRKSFAGITPDRLAGILREAERGQLESWADLVSFMLRTDLHLASVYETRLFAVTSADLDVQPGRAKPGEEQQAELAAELFREELERDRELESVLHGLIHAEGVGYAVAQHDWKRVTRSDGTPIVSSTPTIIEVRDIEFAPDWSAVVRSWDPGGTPRWIPTTDEPARWITHIPRKLDTPNLSGDLMACAWMWIFKRWAQIYRQTALERFSAPFVYGTVPTNATRQVREELLEGLENLASDQVAVFEASTSVALLESAKSPVDVVDAALKSMSDEMTKRLLGATDFVDASGGSFARADVQMRVGALPRFMTIAKRVSGTLERDWAAPFLGFNRQLFGGIVPPLPTVSFKFLQDESAEVDQLAVDAGAVTIDELRTARGLPAWGQEGGGSRVIQVAVPAAAPAFSTSPPPGGADADLPFARASTARLSSTAPSTSPTSAGSRVRTRRVPFAASGDQD